MSESGPDSSDYSYDLDDQEYQQDLGYTDNLSNSSSECTSSDEEDYPPEPVEVQVPEAVRQRPFTMPVPGVSYVDTVAAAYTIDPGSRYSSESNSHTRALLKDTVPPDYAPERWPAYVDFLFVFSSFMAAVFAAYYTLT